MKNNRDYIEVLSTTVSDGAGGGGNGLRIAIQYSSRPRS